MIAKIFRKIVSIVFNFKRRFFQALLAMMAMMLLALAVGKTYQHWDNDPDRGGIALTDGRFNENYDTPVYLDQGWSESDSLWFYNVTQGSALIPYDFYLNLEVEGSNVLVRDNSVMDKHRYLPQKPTFFNPDGLAVGFVKDSYQGRDYIGYTCAACHTSQVNYQGKAIRIDGGPAMADMVGYLSELQASMLQTLADSGKNKRFVDAVLALNNDYDTAEEVNADLKKWTDNIVQYNTINHSNVDYGYARLDAFGRIYNRVLKHVPNRQQVYDALSQITKANHEYLLTDSEVEKVMEGIDEIIIGDDQFTLIVNRLMSKEPGYPGLGMSGIFRVRNALFNPPNAPVSYPFLWDIAQHDYVQWNGLAANAGVGPLGRNTGEVIGVFAKLDWKAEDPFFSLSAYISGQSNKTKKINFESSVDIVNLERLEAHLRNLKSPVWPEEILGKIDQQKAKRGRKIYGRYCQSCHELIDRDDWNRLVVAQMSSLNEIGTDPAMAMNSVTYTGKAGNFKYVYQGTEVGDVIVGEDAPVVQVLTAVTSGVIATPDPDKWFLRRWLDRLYILVSSYFSNTIKPSIKAGKYDADTTSSPYASLVSYKARPLNGIWATAPYLHNGSVPSLYDLMLPKKREGEETEDGEYRPDSFMVGSREFDATKVGFKTEGYDGFNFTTVQRGNYNTGHEYAAGKTAQKNGEILPPLNRAERLDLLEFLKTL